MFWVRVRLGLRLTFRVRPRLGLSTAQEPIASSRDTGAAKVMPRLFPQFWLLLHLCELAMAVAMGCTPEGFFPIRPITALLCHVESSQHHSNQQYLHSYAEVPSQNSIKLLKTAHNFTRDEQLELALGRAVVLACRYNNSLVLKYLNK